MAARPAVTSQHKTTKWYSCWLLPSYFFVRLLETLYLTVDKGARNPLDLPWGLLMPFLLVHFHFMSFLDPAEFCSSRDIWLPHLPGTWVGHLYPRSCTPIRSLQTNSWNKLCFLYYIIFPFSFFPPKPHTYSSLLTFKFMVSFQ